MENDTTRRRPYRPARARILRGPVPTTYSTNLTFPSWHTDPLCGGLERVERDHLDVRTFPDAASLAADDEGRICRMCTLESLLRTVLRPKSGEPQVYVTFSSKAPVSGPSRRTTPPTTSGETRLRRLAKTFTFETTTAPNSGIVAYGYVPVRALDALATNLDTLALPWVRRTPSNEHVQCFWTLVDDHDGHLDAAGRRDLWRTAGLLTR